jgi:hypothetical protein
MANWTGGCLCGAVRYECEGDPSAVGICECTRCQRHSGSAFLIGVIWSKESVKIEGDLKTYEAYIHGPDAGLYRHFCPECGSNVSITLDRYPEIRSMMGGTLDDAARLSRWPVRVAGRSSYAGRISRSTRTNYAPRSQVTPGWCCSTHRTTRPARCSVAPNSS